MSDEKDKYAWFYKPEQMLKSHLEEILRRVKNIEEKVCDETTAPKYKLSDLLKNVTPENCHGEVDWGPDVGNEIIEPFCPSATVIKEEQEKIENTLREQVSRFNISPPVSIIESDIHEFGPTRGELREKLRRYQKAMRHAINQMNNDAVFMSVHGCDSRPDPVLVDIKKELEEDEIDGFY